MNRLTRATRPGRAPAVAAGLLTLIAATRPAPGVEPKPATPPGPAKAAPPPVMEQSVRVTLDRVGNARFDVTATCPAAVRECLQPLKKADIGGPALLRLLELGQTWYAATDVAATFGDADRRIDIRFTIPGLGRPQPDGLWVVPLPPDADPKGVAVHGRTAEFKTTHASALRPAQHPLARAARTYRYEFPVGTEQLRALSDPPRLCGHFPPTGDAADKGPKAELRLEAARHVVSCAAKSYADEHFPRLWAARTRLENTGGQALADYRVRFRIAGYAEWSAWKRCPTVAPGQAVCDAYFPILDIDKVRTLEGSRRATLEAEYEYRTRDGRVVRESDAAELTLLGANEAVLTSLPIDACLDFHERTNIAPVVLGSFVTKDDPVIRRVAGLVSGQADGALAASDNPADALEFMEALYRFMGHNRIAYQTPPGEVVGRDFIQHVKYGRDVLRNRAGTCIDLAIFYASVCEAVGLKTVLMVVPGHCYPAVLLPADGSEHTLAAVETTMIGKSEFREARAVGQRNLARDIPRYPPVVIPLVRRQGVHSLELAPLPENALDQWGGYKPAPPSLVGVWVANADVYVLQHIVRPDGTCEWSMTDRAGRLFAQWAGRYSYADGSYHFTGTGPYAGSSSRCSFTWEGKDRFSSKILECTDPRLVGVAHVHHRVALTARVLAGHVTAASASGRKGLTVSLDLEVANAQGRECHVVAQVRLAGKRPEGAEEAAGATAIIPQVPQSAYKGLEVFVPVGHLPAAAEEIDGVFEARVYYRGVPLGPPLRGRAALAKEAGAGASR